MKLPELNATVLQKINVAPGLMILQVAPVGWELVPFHAGQYAMIGLPSSAPRCDIAEPEPQPPTDEALLQRSYSIASVASKLDYVEFYIALVPEGALSPRLFALNVGDKLLLSKNFSGFFTLQKVPEDANIVLVATGTGLSPCMGIIRSHLDPDSKRKFALIQGARHSSELGYRSELDALGRICENFTYINTISRPDDEPVPWSGHSGYVQEIWQSGMIAEIWGFEPTPENTHVFASGSPAMCETMAEIMVESGYTEQTFKEAGQFHIERFW